MNDWPGSAWLHQYALMIFPILGCMIGSFLNVVVFRLPNMMQQQWSRDVADFIGQPLFGPWQRYDLAWPSSHCPACKTPILPWHNIPVIGYLLTRGKCFACGIPISYRYPIIEACTGLIFFLLAYAIRFHHLPLEQGIAFCLLAACLIALALIDLDTYLLPDQITLPLLWLGLLKTLWLQDIPLDSALIGAVIGYLSLWIVYQGFKFLTGKEGMGFGDFKLLAAMGAWFGWESLLSIVLLASLLGSVLGLLWLRRQGHDHQQPIPFGPALVLGGFVWLFGRVYQLPYMTWIQL